MDYLGLQYDIGGIYAIINCANGKVYVGSAVDIKRRWIRHVHRLRLGTHTNPILQSAWNKYGESSFDFLILEEVSDRLWLMVREQLWLNDVQPWKRENGYNILPSAESRLGHVPSLESRRKQSISLSKSKTGTKASEFQRQRMSIAHLGKPWTEKQRLAKHDLSFMDADWCKAISVRTSGENNPFFGKTHPPELLPVVRKNAELGRHIRWHVNRGIINPNCVLCGIGIS